MPTYKNLEYVHACDLHDDSSYSTDERVLLQQPPVSAPTHSLDVDSVPQDYTLVCDISNHDFVDKIRCDAAIDYTFNNIEGSEMCSKISENDVHASHKYSNDVPPLDGKNTSKNILKECSINLVKYSFASVTSSSHVVLATSIVSPVTSSTSEEFPSNIYKPMQFSQYLDLFKSYKNEKLFVEIFSRFINPITQKHITTKKQTTTMLKGCLII